MRPIRATPAFLALALLSAACQITEFASAPDGGSDDAGPTPPSSSDAQDEATDDSSPPDVFVDATLFDAADAGGEASSDGAYDADAIADAGDASSEGGADAGRPPITLPATGVCSLDGWCWVAPFPTHNALYTSTSTGPTDTWFGGNDTLLHHDGTTWRGVTGFGKSISHMSAATTTDAWALTGGNTYLRLNGTTWTPGTFPTGFTIRRVWARTATDAWAVGNTGTILHFNGTTWSATASGTLTDLTDVFGFSATDVWAVGGNDVLHYDGNAWGAPSVAPPSGQGAGFVWGSASNDVWIVGIRPYHFNGSTWTIPNSMASIDAIGIAGNGPNDVVFLSKGIGLSYWWTGSSLISTYELARGCYVSLAARGPGRGYWFMGETAPGPISTECPLTIWDSNGFNPAFSAAAPRIQQAWTPGGSDVWALAAGGGLLRGDGVNWTAPAWGPVPATGVRGSSSNDVFINGTSGGIVSHYDGMTFSTTTVGQPITLYKPWVPAPQRAWALGSDKHAWYYDGQAWTDRGAAPIVGEICGFGPNDAWAFGAGVWRFNGASWSQVPVTHSGPPLDSFNSCWATGPNDVWGATAASGTIVHFDGNALTTLIDAPLGPAEGVQAGSLAWATANELYAANVQEKVLHWSMNAWRVERPGTTHHQLNTTAASSPTDVWLFGEGIVLKRK